MATAAFTPTLKCVCKHQYQDERYGEGKRVYVTNLKGQKICTVCSKIHGDTGK